MKKIILLTAVLATVFSCCPQHSGSIDVVPYPNKVTVSSGSFDAAGAPIYFDKRLDEASKAAVLNFASQISLTCGQECPISEGTAEGGINFILNPSLPSEAYKLTVMKSEVTAEASDLNGFIYSIQTLKQMLPVEVFGKVAAPQVDWTVQCAVIDDAPRFHYRGLHLDVARHFFDVDEVKKYLDMMEVNKQNIFHWHLTDDQGWRIEIKRYPELTAIGSVRKGTCIKKDWDNLDGVPYGGWYTQEQIREVVAYAATKGITVIPEIDLPGHMVAALTAYPQLGCTGGPYEVWTRWGIADDVLCVGKEETMTFLENVLSEVVELFPSEYIHIGGDECPKIRWENCPVCQAKIKELGLKGDDKHSAEHFLQSYVTARMEKFLESKGRKIIGWDEILEGEIAPNATVMSWRGIEGGIEASRLGHDAIMVPQSHCYLDHYQSDTPEEEPFGIGGCSPVDKLYGYEPFTDDMTDDMKSHIIGVQANLWTEYIATTEHLEYMLLPRATAVSEVQWCNPSVKDWDRFVKSSEHFCKIYEQMGFNYCKHIVDIRNGKK
ncbi:MAG: beta-N-acetylhexosaminidase [Candidatus Cryptobacteroides sp.]